jgi:predicted transcriptional regulator
MSDGGEYPGLLQGDFTMTISERLREAIRKYDSVYAVARDSGVSQSVLQRFVTGRRDLRLSTADRLARFFRLELRPEGATDATQQ